MTAIPKVKKAPAGDGVSPKGYKWTITATVKPAKVGSEFYANGKKYSAAAMTLSQTVASAAAGISWRQANSADKTYTSTMAVKPTIKSTIAKPNVDGVSDDSYSFTTNSGMALTSGTVTASNSTVQAFKVGTTGTFGLNITHSATLKDAITTTAIQVQQVTCLDV